MSGRQKVSLSFLAACLSIMTACGQRPVENSPYDWPQRRGPDNNGISRETEWNPHALANSVPVLWTVKIGSGYSAVAVKGGRVYAVGTVEGGLVVWCLREESGKVIWRSRISDTLESQSTPTIGPDSVFVLSKDGVLLKLDSRSGRLRWRKDLVSAYGAVLPTHGFASSPVLEGRYVVLTVNSAGMAVDQDTGALVWVSEKPPGKLNAIREESMGVDYSTPVVYSAGGKRMALISSYRGLSSVEVETGKLGWLYPWDLYSGFQVPDPVVVGEDVFIPSDFTPRGNPACSLLRMERGAYAVQWKSLELCSDISTPVIVDGFIYACQGGPSFNTAYLRCLDLQTGRLRWEEHLSEGSGNDSISLISAAGKLIILNEKGTLSIAEASPDGYREISRCDVLLAKKTVRRFWMPPVLSGGRIYCRNLPGELVCVDVHK